MHKGSCLCGKVQFEITAEPKAASHCHCRICQKQHGAAFATYVSVKKSDFRYTAGEEFLTSYNSSANIQRKFCYVCGSNIEWSGSESHPDWVSVTLASFDTEFIPVSIKSVHIDSRVCWLDAQDIK